MSSLKKTADTLEDLMRWNIYPGPGFPPAYNIQRRWKQLTPTRLQQATVLGNTIFHQIEAAGRALVASKAKYVYPGSSTGTLQFREFYRKVCAILHLNLETTKNEDAILAAVFILKNSYQTNSFPHAVATLFTILRNGGQPDSKFGCGSDPDVQFLITNQGCQVADVSYGQLGVVESPCSKNTYKRPPMPFPQSRDRDERRRRGGRAKSKSRSKSRRRRLAPV
jgi:hypothetical protein